ncbi:methionine--tRNA ligase [Candidatus Giovannonibacteria bacterium]|nr:methionine--tRNA ligase [Candidatus Giovannonibacteria bacterium]
MSKFYITTPIFYVNAPPHLGHAYADIIADIIARYHRLRGDETFFLTGTDEHGAKVARAAEKAGVEIPKFVESVRENFRKLASVLNISNDDFIFTADEERHFPGAIKLWKKLEEAGDIYKGVYEGMYCVGHEAFITEKDLEDGKCPDHNEAPQIIKEENYFFRLSKYTEPLKKAVEFGELAILPKKRAHELSSLLEEGLRDISFSRPSKDISWGIPVPGDQTQTMYVWCDALANYISALGYGREDESKFQKFWPADVHLVGKDILRFHTAFWPAMLLSAGLPLPKTILVHGLVRVGGRKMSKTLGNVVDPFEIVKNYGADAFRYYLSREVGLFEDGEFTEEKFAAAYEGNLVKGVGNYVRRVSTMIESYFAGSLGEIGEERVAAVPLRKGSLDFLNIEKKSDSEIEFFSIPYFVNEILWKKYVEAFASYEVNRAADIAFGFLKELDSYVDDYKPFKLIETDKEKAEAVLWSLSYGALALAKMLYPFMPATSEEILKIYGVESFDQNSWKTFKVSKHAQLFPKKE